MRTYKVVSLCLIGVVVMAGGGVRSGWAGAGGEEALPQAGVLDFKVVSRLTQEPIGGAKLEIRIGREKREDITNEQGRCRIELGTTSPEYLSIKTSHPGLVPMQVSWRPGEGREAIPSGYTLAMDRGTSLGGIIQDEDGRPIEGVAVYLLVPGRGRQGIERIAISDYQEKTDGKGQWRCDVMPANLEDLWIRLEHADYISDEMYGKTPKPPMERLRDMTGIMVMKKGLTVTGQVLDAQGLPVEGASVAQGSDRFGSEYPSTKTNKEGRFQFRNARSGEMILTIQAKGYAPDLRQIVVSEGGEPVEFRLDQGRTLRGQVVDKAGNPVTGAFVAADTWRGHRSLKWRVDTDAQGRFQWDDAPADEVQIDMGKQGFMSVRNHRMTASDKEYLITMPPVLRIHGRVIDKETTNPVAGFTLVPGIDWGDGQPLYWDRRNTKSFTEGRYEVTYSEWRIGQVVRIEASGYVPEVSRPITPEEGDAVLDFVLTRGTGPSGTVAFPGGKPGAGVTVMLATPSQAVYIRDGRRQRDQDNVFVETGPDGRFSFPAQTDPYILAFLHEKGYAEVLGDDLDTSTAVILQPWGRVQGRLLIGSRPGINEGIRMIPDRPDETGAPRIHHEFSTVTDKDGRFVFNHTPPGKARVYREIPMGEMGTRFSHDVILDIKVGETMTVTIGGTGRPVIGQVAIPERLKGDIDWQRADSTLSIAASGSPYRVLAVTFKADGSFVADDIPAGDYSFRLGVYSPPANRNTFRGDLIGQLTHSFTVPEMPGGRSDEPLDLGVLELQAVGKAAVPSSLVGKSLPDLKPLGVSVADANDKPLLLCFMDMEQRPSRRCLTDLAKKTGDLSAKGVCVVVIQVSKIDLKQYEEWIKANQVTLPIHGMEGDFEAKKMGWGVKALPWLILTDKEHTVVAEGFAIGELDMHLEQVK